MQFHVHEEDVKALIVIGLAAAKIGEVMAPPPKKPVAAGMWGRVVCC